MESSLGIDLADGAASRPFGKLVMREAADDENGLVENEETQHPASPRRPLSLPLTRNSHADVLNEGISRTPTRSSTDLPNQVGNTILNLTSAPTPSGNASAILEENQGEELYENGRTPAFCRNQQWETNYKEAAIFLEEGKNNDKFSHHPRSREALPAYLLVHSPWFNILDFTAALTLLTLGFFENPAVDGLAVPPQIHAIIELVTLSLITILTGLRTRWIGWRTFFRHKRTTIKVATLTIMVVDAIVVVVRARSHFRVMRCLRPIFLIDNYYCGGVRRFVRQIFQSLAPILDMLILVFFVMLMYSVFGFYLFSKIDRDNFQTLSRSFISLFILLTTANDPDVMMESYNHNRLSAAFFISYLAINLYFLMNLLLAVVYDVFTRIEKEKFRRLFLHKRKAAQHAFGLLVTKERPDLVSFQHFEGLLMQFKPRSSPTESYLIFKLLNKTRSGYLTVDEFHGVYDACLYNWRVFKKKDAWFSDMHPTIVKILDVIHKIVKSKVFEYSVYLVVLSNGVILVVQTGLLSADSDFNNSQIYTRWVSYFYVGLYTLEASLKLLGLGITRYFSSYWNLFDFIVTILSIAALMIEILGVPLYYVIILRPLRLLTLFRMKKRFRDVFGTAVILVPRLFSAIIVLLLLYYFFAIIGMELFHDLPLKNCCKNTSVEQFFYYENTSEHLAYYWLNNFDNMPTAGVTLFELTVVNNWFIIMEGHAIVTNEWSRIFFMTFYIVTMIVMTIIVAFILEAFLFRIQYKESLSKADEIKKLTAEVYLTGQEIHDMILHSNLTEDLTGISAINPRDQYCFVGRKSRTKEQLQSMMYSEEMEQWLAEAKEEEGRSRARLEAVVLRERQRREEEQPSVSVRRRSIWKPRTSAEREIRTPSPREGVLVQVVEDEDEITTIRRQILPDISQNNS